MKSQSYDKPPVFQNIGNGKTHYNYNITKEETPEGIIYKYDQVTIPDEVTYNSVVDAVIRNKYPLSEEFAIQRQRDCKPEEFEEYNDFCESVKARVRKDMAE